MKNIKKIFLSLLVLVSLFTITNVRADDYVYGDDNVVINTPAKHSIFGAGNSVSLNEEIDGISFLAGNVVNVNKQSEYAFVAGNQITINANTVKDLFVAGNGITVAGDVGRDAYIAGSTVVITGTVNGNLFVGGSYVDLSNATVNGNVESSCATIRLNDSTVINGTLAVDKETIVNKTDGATIGELKVREISIPSARLDKKDLFRARVISLVTDLFMTLASLVILFAVFPRLYKFITKEREAKDIGNYALKGFGYLFLVPLAAIFAMALVVTIPLSIAVLLLYVVAILLGSLLVPAYLGHVLLTKLFKAKENMYLSFLVGSVFYVLVGLVPVLGGLFEFAVLIIGLGFVGELFNKLKDYAKK